MSESQVRDEFDEGFDAQVGVPAAKPEPEQADEQPSQVTEQVKPEPVIDDPVKQALSQFEERMEKQLRNIHGHIGGLKDTQLKMQEMLTAASKTAAAHVSDAPTQSQVQEAMANPQEWESLKGEFPEWANATEKYMDAKLAALKAPQALDPDAVDRRVQEKLAPEIDRVRQEVKAELIDLRMQSHHKDWSRVINSPEFLSWEKTLPPEEQEKFLNSSDPTYVAEIITKFKTAREQKPQAQPNPRQNIIEAAVSPRGDGGHAPAPSEDDEFNAGFQSG